MKRYKHLVIGINLLLILSFLNFSVWKKEKNLENGKLILLELAPVDPRSLLQGDYMRLNYNFSNNNTGIRYPKTGYCIIQIAKNGLAKIIRLQEQKEPLFPNEYVLKYRKGPGTQILLGAESYFFQEGQAKTFEKAKYGGLKTDSDGNSLLIGLFDEKYQLIQY